MAKSVQALITPEVLKWVRERRIRLDLDFSAEKLKIDPECLEAWENGIEKLTFCRSELQLATMCKMLRKNRQLNASVCVEFSLDFYAQQDVNLIHIYIEKGERIKKGLWRYSIVGQVLTLIGISMIQWNKVLLPGPPE